jgi:hypothetical protein
MVHKLCMLGNGTLLSSYSGSIMELSTIMTLPRSLTRSLCYSLMLSARSGLVLETVFDEEASDGGSLFPIG